MSGQCPATSWMPESTGYFALAISHQSWGEKTCCLGDTAPTSAQGLGSYCPPRSHSSLPWLQMTHTVHKTVLKDSATQHPWPRPVLASHWLPGHGWALAFSSLSTSRHFSTTHISQHPEEVLTWAQGNPQGLPSTQMAQRQRWCSPA
jgi:hypothetical protein